MLGSVVAVDVEALVGSNVSVQAEYDGNNVGNVLGASEGIADGFGVGVFNKYVGVDDGDTVGVALGDIDGITLR